MEWTMPDFKNKKVIRNRVFNILLKYVLDNPLDEGFLHITFTFCLQPKTGPKSPKTFHSKPILSFLLKI